MEPLKDILEWVVGIALFINAGLFIPQARRILKTKSTEGISVITFLGFLGIQLMIVIHGFIQRDFILIMGYSFSMLTCGTVVFLLFYYRNAPISQGESLSERVELLEKIIALMPGHVYWVNKEGIYLGCNDNQAKSAGLYSRKDILHKRNRDLPWNFNAGMLPEALDKINQEVIQTGKTLVVEEPAILADGTELIFLSSKAPLRDPLGEIIGMLGISIDITARKETEKALRIEKAKAESANQAKTEFLENMRHDIRTPLSGIIGLSELLKKETGPHKLQSFAASLAGASQELLRFLNEILESIYVASGEVPLLKKKFSLKEILENLVKLHQPIAIEKSLCLTLEIDKAIPNVLIGDPVRIYRIVLELLANALKFTSEGYVAISVTLKKQGRQEVVIQIQVEDTGIGILPEKQAELFLSFKRLTPSYEGIYKGAGLGLSIVKQFLNDLKGEIYVESQVNQGTQFVCILPLQIPLLETEPFEAEVERTNKPALKRGLVVEDEPNSALFTKTLFAEEGCEIDLAENGKTAIERAKTHRYDFIIMDIGLPDMDGFKVTQAIRSDEATKKHCTFILGLTAHLDLEKKQRGLDVGIDKIFTKPLTQEMIRIVLKNMDSKINNFLPYSSKSGKV